MSASTAVPEENGTLDDGRTVAELLDSPRWHFASTLAERVAGWRAHGSPRGPVDGALAARRLERWKTQSAFAKNPGLWEERLASGGISEEELLYLLGESAEQIRAYTSEPAWLSVIAAAYGDGGRAEELAWPPNADLQRCRFLPFVEPLVRLFAGRLEEEARRILAAHPGAPFSPAIARVLTAHLPDHFAMMLNRTLLVEMHALKLDERLEGETPEARFEDFLEKLRSKRYALEILERFPVLARQVVLRLELWRNACLELLHGLANDADALAAQFNGGKSPGLVRDVYGALSDFHRDGRSVLDR